MKTGRFAVLAVCIFIFSLISGCGSKTPAELVFSDMEEILDRAYGDLGSPEINWDTMKQVKDIGFEEMLRKREDWPDGTVFSISVMEDHIFIYVKVGESVKEGTWRP